MIHEFDPYFNYRTTLFLTKNGFYESWNWFDTESWYPLGWIIGGTLFPGLMVTSALIYRSLRFLTFAVHIHKEIWDADAGLAAAALIAICPGYISRSVAGSYDNEGVAIFALLLTFYFFVKAVNTGSLAWGLASALWYSYMVSTWAGSASWDSSMCSPVSTWPPPISPPPLSRSIRSSSDASRHRLRPLAGFPVSSGAEIPPAGPPPATLSTARLSEQASLSSARLPEQARLSPFRPCSSGGSPPVSGCDRFPVVSGFVC